MSSTTNQNDVLIIHVWPEPSAVGRSLWPNCKPLTDEREDDVWDRLRDLTTNPSVRRKVMVMTCSNDYEADKTEVLTEFQRGNFNFETIHFLERLTRKEQQWRPERPHRVLVERAETDGHTVIESKPTNSKDPGHYREIITHIPITLASSVDAKGIVDLYRTKEHSALLIWHPRTSLDFGPDGDDLRHLPYLKECGVRFPIYIFHGEVHPEKWGVEIDGDANRAYRKNGSWEDAFPSLQAVELTPQQVIVEEMVIGGNIHVIAAPPESYKTMFLIELSSAVLEQRPVFDLLKTKSRHPILFLCSDMSPSLLDYYAAPFNLRKHGEDFRVMKDDSLIPNITDPVLQKAVKGRILILDTMLDFAHIEKASESSEWNTFMENLRYLMKIHGCVAVVMTAHTTRAEVKSDSDNINDAEYFKDSVTFHGKSDIGIGLKLLKGTSQVQVKRIKGRGFKQKGFRFTIAVRDEEGNSNLDGGRFPVCTRPEDMKELTEQRKAQGGRKPDPQLKLKMELAAKTPGSLQDKADAVNAEYGSNHQASTIKKWSDKSKFDQEVTQ